ncbi:uncharacterized protein TA03965 [Theileria annulata]|uniref:Uncharacterized protein n=1 Tax=Theileria annulata TaxID=5874 RepID=Q4UCB2_THEAN|nr:uncharacterized protein TA03965 [Theileria annulata]CAI75539.1 hypothetical protein, conserved [Theileria annulata]|eukprot:XP_955015.1 hypothetical protein, conserved [Theileria annulata]
MSLCGVSQLFSDEHNECPAECPFWAPSSVWKYIGVCSEVGVCKRFNPILNYADSYNNVCLPCKVFGCISCKYSNEPDSMVPVTDTLKKLPDYCIECAKGYKRSEDGTSCYIVGSTLWSKLFYFILIYLLICIAIVTIRILVNRDKFKSNFRNLVNALKNQQKKLLRDFTSPENRLYKLFTDLTNQNLSGLGLILYFRSLGFLVIVMSLLFFVSLAHVHIPCSNMIRLFKDPFRIYYFARANHVPRSFIANFFAKNANKLVDDIFNFKSVDEAITWNVTQYSNEISGVMYVLYVSVMVMTVVYFVSQRRAIIKFMSKSSKMRDLTLVIKNLPSSLTDEEQIKEMIYTCTNIRPVTVTVCYDLKREKKLISTLDQTIEDFNHTSQTNDSYVCSILYTLINLHINIYTINIYTING